MLQSTLHAKPFTLDSCFAKRMLLRSGHGQPYRRVEDVRPPKQLPGGGALCSRDMIRGDVGGKVIRQVLLCKYPFLKRIWFWLCAWDLDLGDAYIHLFQRAYIMLQGMFV